MTRCAWTRLLIQFSVSQGLVQPGTGHGPFAFDSCGRQIHDLGRLFDREPAEITKLDNSALLSIYLSQGIERFVERQQRRVRLQGNPGSFLEREILHFATTLFSAVPTGAVNQNAAHRLSSDGKKVSAVLPARVPLITPLKIGSVYHPIRSQTITPPHPPT